MSQNFRQQALSVMLVAASLLTAAAAGADDAEPAPIVVADYTVFVDPPTGFVFVKLPQRWAFAGRIDAGAVAQLPANVVTSLLPLPVAFRTAPATADRAAR